MGGSYSYGLALDFVDATGKVIGFVQQESLDGTDDPFGIQDKDWTSRGQNSLISDNWGLTKAKGFHYYPDGTTDPFHMLDVVGAALLIVIEVGGIVVLVVWMANVPRTDCKGSTFQDKHGDGDVDLICTKPVP